LRQKLIEAVSPAANLRQRLIFPLVAKLSRPGTDHLPYDFPGYAQLPTDRFDGLALLKKRAADLCNRLHDQHPNLGFLESWKPMWTLCSGVPIGSRSPRKGGPFCMPIHTLPTNGRLEAVGGPQIVPSSAVKEQPGRTP